MADDTESLHEPNRFQLTGPLFVIGPYPWPTDQEHLLRSLVRLKAGAGSSPRSCVALFTELGLAQQFVASLGQQGMEQKPLTLATLDDFAAALEGLARLGETHVGIDPGGGRARRVSIAGLLEDIRKQKP